MTYNSIDISVDTARPLMLLEFADDFGTYWRYNTGVTDIGFQSNTFTSERAKISEPELSVNAFRNTITIQLSRGNALGLEFISGPLESKVTVTAYRLFDVDSGGPQFIFYWFGIVQAVSFDKEARPTFVCEPRTSTVQRVGNRRVCQVMCDLGLYSTGLGSCNVNPESFKIIGTTHTIVNDLILSSIQFGDQPTDWLRGGEIVSGNSRRLILDHQSGSGDGSITISRALRDPELDSGDNVVFTAYAGCNHTAAICLSKFNNKVNYGGQEFLPTKNPFMGDSLM